jgi:hypothetical protein
MERRGSRHVPQRTCVECRAKASKSALLRIAGKPRDGWEPDPAGRRPGRGIYICRRKDCVEGFVKRIGTPKGAARWRMGPGGAVLARRLSAMWKDMEEREDVRTAGGVDGESAHT